MTSTARMLLISPAFFGYETDIRRAIESHGIAVDFFDERPSNSSFAKAAFRAGGRFAQSLVGRHYRRLLKNVARTSYSHVLIIKGEVVPLWVVKQLRHLNPDAKFVYYSFDAIPTGSNCLQLLGEMDECYSFDPSDVAKHRMLTFKPLFYADDFVLDEGAVSREHELTFVGTLHSDRYNFVSSLFGSFDSTHGFFYVPARWFFALNKYVTRSFQGVGWSEVSFKKLSKRDVATVFQNSRAVLDLQRDNQSGLTMRTFEVLASGAILVTGNASIRNAEFFDSERILVVENYDELDASERLRAALSELPAHNGPPVGFEKYAVRNWVEDFIR